MPITAHKKKRIEDLVCIIWKDWTYLFKTGRLVIGLHSNACLLRPLISAGLHKRGVRSLGDVQWGGMFTLHPSWRSVPILWEGPGSQRTNKQPPYTQASLGRSNFGWLWLVKREREREREVRWWRWWSAAAAARRRRRRRRTQETGGVCRMGCVDSKAISWSFVQERGGFILEISSFFFPPTAWSITQCQKTRNTITTTIIMILRELSLSLSLSLIQTDYR